MFDRVPKTPGVTFYETHLNVAWELSNQEVSHKVSVPRVRPSEITMFEKNKQIFFMSMSRTLFGAEKFRLE